jgi:N-acetyl-gamma-glutamyl-phosphate reductase
MGHKHVPEMQRYAGLAHPPLFAPAVIDAHRGMVVEVPLPLSAMPMAGSPEALRLALVEFYADSKVVTVHDEPKDELLLRRSMQPSDRLDLWVFGAKDGAQARLVARLDNLGKGASGAAVQSLNLMAGLDETAGLNL